MTDKLYVTDESGKNTHIMISVNAYEDLLEKAEMLNDVQAFQLAISDGDETVPGELVDRLINGENPIKVWREYKGLKIKELAVQADLTPSYLSMIESGKREPSVKSLKAIASVLSVDIDDLIAG